MNKEGLIAPTPEKIGIPINGINYSYSIAKSENEEESLTIKLYDPSEKSNTYFTYDAPSQKLKEEIKFLFFCESLDEMIDSLREVFSQGNAIVEEKDGEFTIEFKVSGFKKKCLIKLVKHEIKQLKEPNNELELKINKLEIKYNDLLNKFEEIKTVKENMIKENEIRNIIKEVIFDKEIKLKLFEEMETLFQTKYNLNNNNNKNNSENIENNVINKLEETINNKQQKLNNEIMTLQKQMKENIEYIKNIKINNNNNFILLQVKIDEKDINKDVRLFNQVSTYKYYCNFERDDIETIIDNDVVDVKYKNSKGDKDSNTEWIEYNLNINYEYYWNFSKVGIHNVKIIFKKKLLRCNELFCGCPNIYKIDCSNLDCSQIIDCSYMFCSQRPLYYFFFFSSGFSSLKEINLGKLDFSLSKDFSYMFHGCGNLEKIDVSYFNTINSKSFREMFSGCSKLKEINVSNFKTRNCENVESMFEGCKSLVSIDMLNWDMKRIKNIKHLFGDCSNLKNIKMNFNDKFTKCSEGSEIFKGLPENGSFIWKKGNNCNNLLKYLPVSWNRTQE